jgi:acyl carrier protein
VASDSQTFVRIEQLLAKKLGIEVASPEADLIESGLLDSLALVELLFEIERQFDVTVALDELEIDSFRTLIAISDFVERQNGFRSGGSS